MESREKMAMHRQSNVMLSRVAASLYWMSRYLERAENLARLLDVNLQLSVDFDRQDAESLQEHWLPVLRSTGSEEAFLKVYPAADSVTVPVCGCGAGECASGPGSDFLRYVGSAQ